MNITKNAESSSIFVQWNEVDDSLPTTYTVTWTSERDLNNIQELPTTLKYNLGGSNNYFIIYITTISYTYSYLVLYQHAAFFIKLIGMKGKTKS